MKKGTYSEEKIIAILQEAEAGVRSEELCRKYGMSENTFYRWKAKFGGLTVSEAKRLRALEEENRRLKHIVADQALDIQALKAVVSKNF
jgi:putative transposase